MKTDYPELAGVKLVYEDMSGDTLDVVVVDANYHVGITIVAANDKDRELVCLNRTEYGCKFMSDVFGDRTNKEPVSRAPHWKRAYRVIFYWLIEQIRTGKLYSHKTTDMHHDCLSNIAYANSKEKACSGGGMSNCAWK